MQIISVRCPCPCSDEELLSLAQREMEQVALTLRSERVEEGFVARTFDTAYDQQYVLVLPTTVSSKPPPGSGRRRLHPRPLGAHSRDKSRLVGGVNEFQIVFPNSEVV
jgi:hypothetical protein